MRKFLIALLALCIAAPVTAQTIPSYTYPSAGTPPFVQLQCNDSYAACLPITSANPIPVSTAAAAATKLNTGQVSVGTASTLVVAARAGRQRVTITVNAAVQCSFGNSGVTTATGFPLQAVAGATLTLNTSAAVYGACGTAATSTGFIEEF